MNLTLAEMETHLNLTADDRNTWTVSSDDPVMQRRLEAIGATLLREGRNGTTKFYTLRADQVLLRTGKRKVSDAQRIQSAINLRASRQSLETVEATDLRIDSVNVGE